LRASSTGWQICFVVLHLPLLGYPAWFLGFQLSSSLKHVSAILFVYELFCRLLSVGGLFYFVLFTIFFLSAVCSCNWDRDTWVYILFLALGAPIVFWVVVAGGLEAGSLTEVSSPMNAIFVHPFRFILRSFVLLFSLIIILVLFCASIYNTSHRPSVVGFVLAVILFLVYLVRYDSSGTYNPNWMNWLG
jgi:hypothetical protein